VETDARESAPTTSEYQRELASWIDEHETELAEHRAPAPIPLGEAVARDRKLQRALFDAGWSRWGWPEHVGGLGGTAVLRAAMYEQLCASGYHIPECFFIIETVGPMMVEFGPELAARFLMLTVSGDELWCQGFSEPGAGSDLASLRLRAVDAGDHWVMNGQKVWSSWGTEATRCVLLARTGAPDSAHRGLSMFLVDFDGPGITRRPIHALTDRDEFAEVFYDDAAVPKDRLIGEVNTGWQLAMYLLQWERGMYAWQRQAYMHSTLQEALARSAGTRPADAAARVGDAYNLMFALRARSGRTVRRLAAGESPGPEISADKLLLGSIEQTTLDVVRELLEPALERDADDETALLRSWYMYSRAATIYGGSADIQRSIIAERVLNLPREPAPGASDRPRRGVAASDGLGTRPPWASDGDDETRAMVRATVREVLASTEGRIEQRLEELGWDEAVADDAEGAIGALFEEQGRLLAATAALDTVVLARVSEEIALPAAASAVVYPSGAKSAAPISKLLDQTTPARVRIDGIMLAGWADAGDVLVPLATADGTGLAVVERADLPDPVAVGGVDPSAGWGVVRGETTVDPGRVLTGDGIASAWRAATAVARRAQAHELVGMVERMLELAVDHASVREQFGRPIGSFQAVQHRLADVYVAYSAAKAAVHEAWIHADARVVDEARTLAGRAYAEACRQCLQALGAIGFTTEHAFSGYVRRGTLLDTLLGTWRSQRDATGARLIDERRVPRVPDL